MANKVKVKINKLQIVFGTAYHAGENEMPENHAIVLKRRAARPSSNLVVEDVVTESTPASTPENIPTDDSSDKRSKKSA